MLLCRACADACDLTAPCSPDMLCTAHSNRRRGLRSRGVALRWPFSFPHMPSAAPQHLTLHLTIHPTLAPAYSELEAARKEAAAAKESVAHEMAIMRRELSSAQRALADSERVSRPAPPGWA